MDTERRSAGRVLDADRLEQMEPKVYLHRFVDELFKMRGSRKRHLFIRAGDELAIAAAQDGSLEVLQLVTVIAMRDEEQE